MEKQIITFSASEQTLTKTGGIDHYASNTVSYVQAIFDLGENWAGFDSVRAVFKTPYKTKPAVLDHSGRCLVPFEVLKYKCKVFVNLVGSISEEGVLTDRLTSYPIEALTIDANASVDNSETAISPTEFEEFVAIVSDDADRAEAGATASEASADNAEASAESALASAQASEASAIRASNSASDASASAQTAQEEAQKITGMVVVVTQLPEGATPTSDWSDGVLTIGIPKGDTGATGATGNGIESAVLNADYTLTLTFTDGTSYTTPSIRGATGATGATGNGISSVTLTSTSGAVKTYTIAFTDGTNTTFDVTDGEVTQAVLDETVTALKAEISENGVVAGANGLVSDSKISDSVPYLYRQTADGQRVGNVVEEEIVGGTVAFNQLVSISESSRSRTANGVTFVDNRDGSYTFYTDENGATANVTSQIINVANAIDNGVYCLLGSVQRTSASGWVLADGYSGVLSYANKEANIHKVTGLTTPSRLDLRVLVSSGAVITTPITVRPQVIDLTQMFGTTIADHLYALETATSGAGVAVFRKMFPNSYYAYNAGELKSVEGLTSHDTTGFNAWDEEWELGTILPATGQNYASTAKIRSKNYIPIVPNTSYCISSQKTTINNQYLYFYDANKDFITYMTISGVNQFVSTTPSNACYVRFIAEGTAYNNDICINISSDRNGQYEPYVKRTYALDSTLTLRGIPKLSDGKIYYDGDVYKADGTVNRKYGIVDLGTLNWNVSTSNPSQHNSEIVNIKKNTDNIVSAKYLNDPSNRASASSMTDGHMVVNARTIYITSGNGVNPSGYLVYELATPTTETAEPYTSPQIVDRYGTEEYVTTGIVPVGHNSKYSEDLKGKIESLPWDFSTLIAPTETAYKATRNYTTGGLLIVNNILYKVTANIANGGTITPNTNVVATTLAEIIANL